MKTFVIDHPLIKNKLTIVRNKHTDSKTFRETINEIAGLMSYEATKDLEVTTIDIETPLAHTKGEALKNPIVIVPILRAGLGMSDAIHMLIPNAKVGHIGLYRDETTFEPAEYYAKFPSEMKDATVLLLDPMLATGGSVIKAYNIVKSHGAEDVRYIGVVASPEGVDAIEKACPDMKNYIASIDDGLTDTKYITPGLGDAGDRLFGTK